MATIKKLRGVYLAPALDAWVVEEAARQSHTISSYLRYLVSEAKKKAEARRRAGLTATDLIALAEEEQRRVG